MEKFGAILQRAARRKGGESILMQSLPEEVSAEHLASLGDDRYLSEMTRCVFQAGFVWKVVNQKWPDFEQTFFGFNPEVIVLLSPDQLDAIAENPAIIRNRQKIYSVPQNAQMILDIADAEGSFASMVQRWPSDQLIELFKLFKKQGSRLGGGTGPRVLRNLGVDTFILSKDVVHCLQQAGVQINQTPSSNRDQTLVQAAFNTWHRETGLPYSHLSRICSWSVGDNYPLDKLVS